MAENWKNPLASRYRNRQRETQTTTAEQESVDSNAHTALKKEGKAISKGLQAYNPEIFKPTYSVEAVLAKNAVADRMLVDDAMAMLEEDKKDKARQKLAQAQREREARARASQPGPGGAATRTPRGPGVLSGSSRGGALSKPNTRHPRSPTTPTSMQPSNRPNAPAPKPTSVTAQKAAEDMEKIMPRMMSMKFRGVQRAAREKAQADQT